MKRITATFPDNTPIDLNALMLAAIDFKLETIENGTGGAKPPTRHVHRPGKGKNALTTLLSHYTPSGFFDIDTARLWLKKEGYNPNTAYGTIVEAVKEKYILDLGARKYQFLRPFTPTTK